MEKTALTIGLKKPQLFLKKNVVVKFVRTNTLIKAFSETLNVATTTSIPTSTVSSYLY